MRWQIIFSCLLLIASCSLNGQLDSAAKAEVIKSLSLFRSELLKDTNNVIAYGVVVHENSKLNWDSLNYLIEQDPIYYVLNPHANNQEKLELRYGKNSILFKMNIDVQKVLYDNRYLVCANNFSLVENEYPFKLKKDLDIFKELEFYKIKYGDTLFDYGTSNLSFAPMLCSIYPNILFYQFAPWLYEHEINENYIIKNFASFKGSSYIELMYHDFNSKNIPKIQCEKVFFNYPIEFSETPSIIFKNAYKLLKPKGYFFFNQHAIWNNNETKLPHKFSVNKVNKLISKSGFKLVESLTLNSKTIYKCIKIGSK